MTCLHNHLALASVLVLCVACGPSSPPDAGKKASGATSDAPLQLTIATWGGVHEPIVRSAVGEGLAKQGIKVNFLFGTSGDRLARLYAEKGNPSVDLSMLPVDRVAKAIEDGVCEPAAASPNIP